MTSLTGGGGLSASSSAASSLEGGDTSVGGDIFDFSRGKREGGLDTNTALIFGAGLLGVVVVMIARSRAGR